MEKNIPASYNEDDIDIKEIITKYFRYWKWFVLSIILFLFLGFVYLSITPKKYNSEGKILLNDTSSNVSPPLFKELANITDYSSSQIEDQIEILKSRRLITKVVDKLELNVKYYQKKRNYTGNL